MIAMIREYSVTMLNVVSVTSFLILYVCDSFLHDLSLYSLLLHLFTYIYNSETEYVQTVLNK